MIRFALSYATTLLTFAVNYMKYGPTLRTILVVNGYCLVSGLAIALLLGFLIPTTQSIWQWLGHILSMILSFLCLLTISVILAWTFFAIPSEIYFKWFQRTEFGDTESDFLQAGDVSEAK